MEIDKKIIQIIADTFNIPADKIDIESSNDTIEQWDSMGHLQLVMAVENELKIRFNTSELEGLKSVKKLVDKAANMLT